MRKDRGLWILEIAEVKSSDTGVEQMGRYQRARLFASQKFLSGLFGVSSKFFSLTPDSES